VILATNRGGKNGPASWLGTGGLERPVSVKFDAAGGALYVVDFGIMKVTEKGSEPHAWYRRNLEADKNVRL
jgi:hypothetical protein